MSFCYMNIAAKRVITGRLSEFMLFLRNGISEYLPSFCSSFCKVAADDFTGERLQSTDDICAPNRIHHEHQETTASRARDLSGASSGLKSCIINFLQIRVDDSLGEMLLGLP